MNKKNIIILRSVSGSGKSHMANILCQKVGYYQVCADDYFYDEDGNYNFDPSKLRDAHDHCKKRFMSMLMCEGGVDTIIVANTNTKESDWKFYEEEGKKAGADIIFLVIENRHGNVNQHNVPEETLHRQEQNIRNSLKLR